MEPQNFEYVQTQVRKNSGLVLTEDKMYLVESRLKPLASRHGLGDHQDLIEYVRSNNDPDLIAQIIDAMTTNETFFFRDIKPFDIFRDTILPGILKRRAEEKSFRIWCCAASTGQEPYTLAIILREMASQLAGWNHQIIATDISAEALKRAESGVYTQFEVQRGLPVQMLIKHFRNRGDMWEIHPSVRSMVDFKRFNLLDDFTAFGGFDVVFCRNVLIYFDLPTKKDLLERISRRMEKDGALILGSSETVVNITNSFAPIPGQPGTYAPAIEREAS